MEGREIDFAALVEWCDKRMPYFMVPRFYEALDALPQTPSGKVKKKELRERGITPGTFDRQAEGIQIASEREKAAKRKALA